MKLVTIIVGFAFVALTFADFTSAQPAPQTFKGYLVDVMCGTHHASEGAAYGEKHDKKCLLMPECTKSGYALMMADNKILKFDAKGSNMALALIKRTEREKDWRVTVSGTLSNETIAVTSLALQ